LCEQRIESNCRILLTMGFFCTEPTSGCFPQETPGAGQMGLPSQKKLCSGRCHARRISD
jgi:hypothetical protein